MNITKKEVEEAVNTALNKFAIAMAVGALFGAVIGYLAFVL